MPNQFRPQDEPFALYQDYGSLEAPLAPGMPESWQGEKAGKNPDRYVLWLQGSLNRALNGRINVDGRIGSETLRALRAFQNLRKLRPGPGSVVCLSTEQALIAAGANPPPAALEARSPETTPPGLTVYVDIPLQIPLGSARSMTGIFFPENYCPITPVDLLVYLHGYKYRAHKPEFSIDSYWSLPQFRLREEVNKSQKNVILVAPTLGPKNQPGSLLCPGGFDRFLGQVMSALKKQGPYATAYRNPSQRNLPAPPIGSIIFACHSGSGWVLRAIAMGSDKNATNIQECWAFDPSSMGDAGGWRMWARPPRKVYHYYGKAVKVTGPNITTQQSRVGHDDMPRVHLLERLLGAHFLRDKSSCTGYRPQPPTSPSPGRGGGSQIEGGSLSFLTRIYGIPLSVIELLQQGQENLALRAAITQGLRDENKLTSILFFARHPERGGKKLVKGEPGFDRLAREWLEIRDRLVRKAILSGSQVRSPEAKPESRSPKKYPAQAAVANALRRCGLERN